MNSKSFKSLLQKQAEHMAPTSEINLWPSIQTRLSTHHAVLLSLNGGSKMKPSSRSLAILAPIGLAIILAVIFMAVMPQGRALAQQFLSLFFQTAPDVRPLDPTTAPGVIKPTLIIVYPTMIATLDPTTAPTVITPATITVYPPTIATLDPTIVPAVITPTANTQAVEDLTRWHLFKPSWLPEGFGLDRTVYRPEKGDVYQAYLYQHPYLYQRATGMQAAYFFLGQRKTPFTDSWPVGESAKVETVQVGDVTGEYVVGAWGGAETYQVWENNPAIQHLRWRANGYYFDLQFDIYGVQEADFADCPYYISKEQLIDIASSMK
jgi:hypothetical protein